MSIVREAREADASAIGRIHVETWQATYPGLLPDAMLVRMSDVRHAASWAQMLSDHDNRRRTLVAEDRQGRGTAVVGDRKSTRLNSSHIQKSRMPSSA